MQASEGSMMAVDEAGRHVELVGIGYLNPADQVMDEMLTGWRYQRLGRNLAFFTIDQREAVVRRFQRFTNEYPWHWTPAHADEFFGDLRAKHNAKQSTIRNYQQAVRAFCGYIAHPDYGCDILSNDLVHRANRLGRPRTQSSALTRQGARCHQAECRRLRAHSECMLRPRSRPTRRPIEDHPLSASPLNDANLMAGLHTSDRVDTKPTEQGGGVESL
jgi:hypothetical protein